MMSLMLEIITSGPQSHKLPLKVYYYKSPIGNVHSNVELKNFIPENCGKNHLGLELLSSLDTQVSKVWVDVTNKQAYNTICLQKSSSKCNKQANTKQHLLDVTNEQAYNTICLQKSSSKCNKQANTK